MEEPSISRVAGDARETICARCRQPLDDLSADWDSQSYCRNCLAESGLEKFDPATTTLEETLRIGFWQAIPLGVLSGAYYAAILALVVTTLFVAFTVAALLGGAFNVGERQIIFWRIPASIALFGGCACAFFAVVTIPLSLFGTLVARRRSIRVSNGIMTETGGMRRVDIDLSQCEWRLASTCATGLTVLSIFRPSVLIQGPGQQFIVCGFNNQTLRFWQCYLSLAVGTATPRPQWWRLWKPATLNFVIATATGLAAGALLEFCLGNRMWTTAGAFLGMLDGLASGLARDLPGRWKTSEESGRWIWALTFAALGARAGSMVGMQGIFICTVLNGLIGWLLFRNAKYAKNATESHK
jgi:hypothetical protein